MIFERVERVAFFRKTMPQIRAGEYEGLEEKVDISNQKLYSLSFLSLLNNIDMALLAGPT